jgi:monoamine oxidase
MTKQPFNMHVNPFGRPMLVSHMGGDLGRDLEKAGEAAVRDMALAAMVEAFGGEIRKRVRKTLLTHWNSDPWTRGGYSHCKPGRAGARAMLANPVGDRIMLAGEHCSPGFFSTVHGAHLSGFAAAQTALEQM